MLILGDSRAFRGVSPTAMHTVLPNLKIVNFAYLLGGLNPLMYKEAERRLDPASSSKTLVLAVTPHSLTPAAAANQHFLEERNRPREDIYQRVYLHWFMELFNPLTPGEILDAILDKQTKPAEMYFQEPHDDGWVASWVVPEDASKQLRFYREIFTKERVSADLVHALVEQTRRWTASGIRVYGVRPPTTEEMVSLEDTMSGFDEQDFVRQFTDAGGIWLTFASDRYHTYDGSHLNKESALRFSMDLGKAIQRHLTDRGP
jgi:hypothetical protein